MTRAMLVLHRWCGIALCLLVAAWCLSGIVMMYVPFPAYDGGERLKTQQPLSFAGCCRLDLIRDAIGDWSIDAFTIDMLADRPVLRLSTGFGPALSYDLSTGGAIGPLTAAQAGQVARSFARQSGQVGDPRLLQVVDFDQWTVSGFQQYRPLFRFALDDGRGTEFYVSGQTGEVVQRTDAFARGWNYFGAVTHWLYPTALRKHAGTWSQVVIWTSLAGIFLVLTGLYVGWVHWRPRAARASPFRGVALWHHYAGLIFGLMTLGWVASGLVSMNPWGFLEGGTSTFERSQLAGLSLNGSQAIDAIELAIRRGVPQDTRQLTSAPFAGQLFVTAGTPTAKLRLDAATWQQTVIEPAQLQTAASRLQPGLPVLNTTLLEQGDGYYYAHKTSPPLPVFRVILDDADQTRYYIDPADGALLRKIDRNGRWWRWLFSALHQWDFAPGLRQRPVWDIVVVTLLAGLSALSLTGVWLGVRYLLRRD